jgi:hypothetical protein
MILETKMSRLPLAVGSMALSVGKFLDHVYPMTRTLEALSSSMPQATSTDAPPKVVDQAMADPFARIFVTNPSSKTPLGNGMISLSRGKLEESVYPAT